MAITVNLDPATERALAERAGREGRTPEEVAADLVRDNVAPEESRFHRAAREIEVLLGGRQLDPATLDKRFAYEDE